ncbi:MAG: L-threonylcarbamoyladenylate synthase [Pseudomonadota bacterium]
MPCKNIPTPLTIAQATERLKQGEIAAIPTETVYGLAVDATNDQAIARIYAAKSRSQNNPLIVHVATTHDAALYVEWNLRAQQLADVFWPGPLTMILAQRKNSPICKRVSAGLETLAIRVPKHPIALEILKKTSLPLAAPSANISGTLSPTTAQHVIDGFKGQVLVVDGGQTKIGLESTVVDLTQTPAIILRPGSITREKLQAVIPIGQPAQEKSSQPKSPGQFGKHYAPKQPLRLNATNVEQREALLSFGTNSIENATKCLNLSPKGNLAEAASNLYQMLHELDHPQFSCIAVAPIPDVDVGVAINDRLRRASQKSEVRGQRSEVSTALK